MDLLLKVYGRIITTHDIVKEFGETLPEWIIVKSPIDYQKQQILELQVDKGEASAIALALETPHSTVIIDDLQARSLAENLGITITGTIGVIIKAKINGIIHSIKPILEKIKQTNFRLSSAVEEIALKQAGE